MNKKCNIPYLLAIGLIIMFGFFVFLLLFNYSFFFETGRDLAINITHNVTTGIDGISQEMINHMDKSKDSYASQGELVPIDLFFLGMWITTFITTIIISISARKQGIMSFFGSLLFLSMIGLFIMTFIEQVRVWLFDNFYYNLFDLTSVSTPIANFYLNNSLIIGFFWIIIVISINQFDGKLTVGNSDSGRFRE